jgi:hypothetical protein
MEKNITIEDKAKAYDEAIKEASIAYKDEDRHLKAVLERIFPELADSKDERIRKAIIKFLIDVNNGAYRKSELEIASWIAWLEKQKPDEWSEEDERIINSIIHDIRTSQHYDTHSIGEYDKKVFWLKSLKDRVQPQNWKPSDEQIKVCKEVYADVLSAKGFNVGTVNSEIKRLEEQLKKLRDE